MGFEAVVALPTTTATRTVTAAVLILVLVLAVLVPAVVVLGDGGLDLGGALAHDDRVALDVLAVHLLGCLEELVWVAEGYEAVSFGFGRYFVTDYARFLQGFPL